jgi:YHS domain-containing protein
MASNALRPEALHGRLITLCGRVFLEADPRYFPKAPYRGVMLYFCTESCLAAFEADPRRFHRAHRRSNDHQTESG